MRHIKIKNHRDDSSVRRLLVLAADPAGEQGLEDLLDECQELKVLAHSAEDGTIDALAAYRHSDQYSLCLEYLAVLPEFQQRGLGRALIEELRLIHRKNVWATTHDDAVDFYRAMGCVISNSAEDPRWPGVARYLCTAPYLPLLHSQPAEDPEYEAVNGQLTRGNIRIDEPSPSWPRDFEELAQRIAGALGPQALAIEHTGSTSVPGLPAKPIIDICLLVPDANDEPSYAPVLEGIGLVFWHREPGWYAHRMFKPAADSSRVDANVHVFSAGSPEYVRMVLFREHLKGNAADRQAYARVKRKAAAQLLAEQGENGLVMDYNRIKEPFIVALHHKLFAS
ncbi:GNAT family N-acetyltransferase [Glutamicibacter sp. JL.03c]|uniref:GNAT family N-acetyltransferase n=1 Tax=Glutamicibacter sp. JL.03c TaxID=2984842 RepID=UPI0021F770B3|nr:GNAT family N-acetyltransferase [Glutamicibacter sp. JL.03c]UYQ76679.1 GNAT family N-acetyltransferase [Glutamicibacter sp. JL.03c]